MIHIELNKLGILLRGAITIGKLYHQKSTVAGQGLLEAYDMETNSAIYPSDRDPLREEEKVEFVE